MISLRVWHDFRKSNTPAAAIAAFAFISFAAGPSGSKAIAAEAPKTVEVYVWAEQPTSAATEQTRWAKDLELRPTTTPSDVMRLVPGLIIGQHHGGGKADQILFRGFDSDHGTDFAVFVDGIPVNMVSHGHGQGYADLHWLIPEAIERVEIYKGPYFAHLGDFATSGAMNIVTKRRDKDSSLMLSGGSFGTQRYLGILSPPEGTPWSPYLAFEAYHNDGPFKNPNDYNRFNLFAKLTPWSTASSNLTLLATLFKTYWNGSGEIPARAVRSGAIGRFDSIDPSEGGRSERQNLSLIYNYADARQAFTAQTWASWYRLNLFSNFTFFLEEPVDGDGIEQADRRFLVGNNVQYRRNYALGELPMETMVGFQSRFDHIHVGLFRQRQRRRLQTTTDNRIDQTNLGYYLQQELRPTEWLRAQVGARLDSLFFDVAPDGDPAQPISGKASKSIVNPKLNLILSPFADTPWRQGTRLFLNFGGGFHSNDARVFIQDPKKRIPRYLGGEIGFRSRFVEKLELGFAYWRGHLESELVFAGDAGTFEPKGRSRRQGLEGELRWEILPWLSYDLDLSYTWAEFVDTGEAVPLAPRLVAYTGLTARHASGLQGRLQLRHVGRRYAIEDRSFKTPRQTIADLLLKYAWKRCEFFLSFENLANARWRSAEHVFESRLAGEPAPVLDSHFTPGDPFTVKGGVTLRFW